MSRVQTESATTKRFITVNLFLATVIKIYKWSRTPLMNPLFILEGNLRARTFQQHKDEFVTWISCEEDIIYYS